MHTLNSTRDNTHFVFSLCKFLCLFICSEIKAGYLIDNRNQSADTFHKEGGYDYDRGYSSYQAYHCIEDHIVSHIGHIFKHFCLVCRNDHNISIICKGITGNLINSLVFIYT